MRQVSRFDGQKRATLNDDEEDDDDDEEDEAKLNAELKQVAAKAKASKAKAAKADAEPQSEGEGEVVNPNDLPLGVSMPTVEDPQLFSELKLSDRTMEAIKAMGFESMTEIQRKAIPPLLR